MATRTTPDEVREIYPTDMTDPEIQAYIDVANAIVTANVTCGLSEEILTEIERWLTAHLIAVTQDPQATKEKLGDAEITYSGQFGHGLESTSYGQTVLMLDTCGTLGNLGKKAISIKAITSFE